MAGIVPLVVGKTYRGIFYGRFPALNVETRNVFYFDFTQEGATSPAATLLDGAFSLYRRLANFLVPYVSSAWQSYQCELQEIDLTAFQAVNSETYIDVNGSTNGGINNDSLPPSDAFTFKYVRPGLAFRHGYKRFAGVPESVQLNGNVNSPAQLAALNVLAGVLASPLWVIVEGGTDPIIPHQILEPRIIRAERGGFPVRPVEHAGPLAVQYRGIGTQNSRKIGRGI